MSVKRGDHRPRHDRVNRRRVRERDERHEEFREKYDDRRTPKQRRKPEASS